MTRPASAVAVSIAHIDIYTNAEVAGVWDAAPSIFIRFHLVPPFSPSNFGRFAARGLLFVRLTDPTILREVIHAIRTIAPDLARDRQDDLSAHAWPTAGRKCGGADARHPVHRAAGGHRSEWLETQGECGRALLHTTSQ